MEKSYNKIKIEGEEIVDSLGKQNISLYTTSNINSVIEDIEKSKEEFTKAKKLRKKDLWKSGGFTRYGRKRR